MSRKITFLTLFLWLTAVTFPVIAQQKADTTYTFRFVPQKDMFYVPWNGNDTELARLLECIEKNKATILDGKLPLLVDGYCNSLGSETENLATAKIRANRVKSELIIRAEILIRKHDARQKLNDWKPRSVPNRNGLPKSSAKRKKPDLPLKRQKPKGRPSNRRQHSKMPSLPILLRKQKPQPIIICPYVPTCCVG